MAKSKDKEKDKDKPSAPKARNDAYVMMLFITLVAIIGGSVLMHLDFEEYGKMAPPKEAPPALTKLGEGGATTAVVPAGKPEDGKAP